MDWDKFNRIEKDRDLTAAEKYLMVCLLDLQNGDEAAYPSLEDLRNKTGMTRTSISRITTRLQREGKLAKKRRPGSSLYIVYPSPEELERWAPEFAQEQHRVAPTRTQSSRDANTEFASRETDPLKDPPTDPPTSNTLAPTAPTPVNFDGWLKRLRETPKNRIGVLGDAFSVLYPHLGEPDYAMIGRTANNVKAASTLLQLLWEVAPTQPKCVDCKDLCKYLQAVHRNRGRQPRKETPPPPNRQQKADASLKAQLKEKKAQRESRQPAEPSI